MNCVVVEFDMFYDVYLRDSYYNYVAVMTRGAKASALATYDVVIGMSVMVLNLFDGECYVVCVVYDLDFVFEDVLYKSFCGGAYLFDLMRDYKYGLGTMKVFIDDFVDFVLMVLINLVVFMDLDNGCVWVGFIVVIGCLM